MQPATAGQNSQPEQETTCEPTTKQYRNPGSLEKLLVSHVLN